MSQLYSLTLEKQFLSGTILHPSTRAETGTVRPADLSKDHGMILSAIDAILASDTGFSMFVLANKLSSLGLKVADVLEPLLYIQSLTGLAIPESAVVGIAREVKTWAIFREMNGATRRMTQETEKPQGRSATEMLSKVTEIFNERVNLLGGTGEDEPVDLYKTMRGFVDEESAFDTRSLATPYPIYNDLFGYLDPGNVYCLAARTKTGKSVWIMNLLHQMAKADEKKDEFRGLILDTEMTREEVQSRLLSSMTGISEFYIRHKIYRKNRGLCKTVDAAIELLKPLWGRVDHIFIGNMELEQQISILKRWTHKHVIRGGRRALAVLDYFKLDGSEFDSNRSRDITLGKKVNAYKNAVKELQIPLFAMVQAGRQNEDTKEGSKIENGSVIAGSDMISQFCSSMMLLQKLTPEERTMFGQEEPGGATHSLKNIYCRQRGPNELGKDCIVKYQAPAAHGKTVTKYTENHLLYSFDRFVVTEVGTLKDAIAGLSAIDVQKQGVPKGALL